MQPHILLDELIAKVGENFRTFGGGQVTVSSNPLAHALKDKPLQFAAGVDVSQVVTFIVIAVLEAELAAQERPIDVSAICRL
jgi:hypothetical protein